MLKISRNDKQLAQLETQTLAQANILERYNLQEYLFNSFDASCGEIHENLEIVGKEVRPSEVVQDRIDLLAIDEEGDAVIIELKRGNDKLQLLQAVCGNDLEVGACRFQGCRWQSMDRNRGVPGRLGIKS